MVFGQGAGPGAAGEQSVLLNGLPPDGPAAPGGGQGDLASTPAAKRAAANTIESELEPRTKKAGDRPDDANGKVMSGLDNWATAAGMKTVQETWDQQVKSLMGRLAGEKGALRATVGTLQATDGERKARIGAVQSNFDKY
ncbi:hypothetical protein GCM10010232_16240 [Streptomyces amakusaensis]|uniref:Uncharacterized protein n=1 Tax=Streptomyces amakusaensis TaxID=67271 RepID=A0ABW0AHK2_9ACTN